MRPKLQRTERVSKPDDVQLEYALQNMGCAYYYQGV